MTTISELFEQEPMRIERGIEYLVGCYYNHVSDIAEVELSQFQYNRDFAQDVECVVFHYQYWDARRSQIMFGVRYQGQWVMLCRNAGRELNDFAHRQVVDAAAYTAMITYLRNEMVRVSGFDPVEVIALDTKVEFDFYGEDVRYRPYI